MFSSSYFKQTRTRQFQVHCSHNKRHNLAGKGISENE